MATLDTPLHAAGASLIVPAGWHSTVEGSSVVLMPPEPGSRVALVQVQAADARNAVEAARQRLEMGTTWPLEGVSQNAPRGGWDEDVELRYRVPPTAGRLIRARALRDGGHWTVLLHDFDQAVADQRGAQLLVITDRLHAPGFQPETFAGRRAKKLDAHAVEALRQFMDEGMRLYGAPAMSFGIVQDGRVVFSGGLGVRESGKPEPVDGQTLYLIASNTKQLTTLMLAKMVDEGRFGWDTPVVDLLPDFALGDAATTRRIRVRHLVCACTGLPRLDYEWLFEYQDATAASTLRTLAGMQPTTGFGELYQYSNQLASAGGYVGAHVRHPGQELGAAYDRAMQELVFGPLGMKSTTFDTGRALRSNHAVAYGADPDGNVALANMPANGSIVPLRPAGGAWSNVDDLLRYLQMELSLGRLPDGSRYISEAALIARRTRQVARGVDGGYGMGIRIDREAGVTVLHHAGAMIGYQSSTFWLPDHGVGVVMLTSYEQGDNLFQPFRRRVLELLFDGDPRAINLLKMGARTWREQWMAERARLQLPADAAQAAQLADRYHNAGMGPVTVHRGPDGTEFDFGEWRSGMASRRNDDGSVGFVTTTPGMEGVQFQVAPPGPQGRRLIVRSAQREYVFEEQAPGSAQRAGSGSP